MHFYENHLGNHHSILYLYVTVPEDTEVGRRSRRILKDLIALGKDTGYLDPIKEALKKL